MEHNCTITLITFYNYDDKGFVTVLMKFQDVSYHKHDIRVYERFL